MSTVAFSKRVSQTCYSFSCCFLSSYCVLGYRHFPPHIHTQREVESGILHCGTLALALLNQDLSCWGESETDSQGQERRLFPSFPFHLGSLLILPQVDIPHLNIPDSEYCWRSVTYPLVFSRLVSEQSWNHTIWQVSSIINSWLQLQPLMWTCLGSSSSWHLQKMSKFPSVPFILLADDVILKRK